MIRWSEHPEYVEFLKEYIPGHQESEIRAAFLGKFEVTLTESQIGGFKHKYHIKSGTTGGRFIKGQVSHNKGQKMSPEVYEKAKNTMFKKGNVPVNHRPVGSERINVDGYVEIKVEEPRKWRLKQRVVYEEYYGEKLTSNDVIIFLDGNKTNLSIDNLMKLNRSELVRYNQMQLHGDNPDLNMSAALLAKIKAKVGKQSKGE